MLSRVDHSFGTSNIPLRGGPRQRGGGGRGDGNGATRLLFEAAETRERRRVQVARRAE
ncbi:hypothetical protein PUN28_012023 [Cardiocondyla obscurior]|uniref:Uncharacterized protein n=1 Tax=Cardiocondyla obscurior TaxID=286306 RepID=A0AAW2F8X8_9HYME